MDGVRGWLKEALQSQGKEEHTHGQANARPMKIVTPEDGRECLPRACQQHACAAGGGSIPTYPAFPIDQYGCPQRPQKMSRTSCSGVLHLLRKVGA